MFQEETRNVLELFFLMCVKSNFFCLVVNWLNQIMNEFDDIEVDSTVRHFIFFSCVVTVMALEVPVYFHPDVVFGLPASMARTTVF